MKKVSLNGIKLLIDFSSLQLFYFLLTSLDNKGMIYA